jgi:hypothetical protein
MGATDPDAHGSHYNIDGGRLFGISKVGLEELFQLGMAEEAHARLLDNGLAARINISA